MLRLTSAARYLIYAYTRRPLNTYRESDPTARVAWRRRPQFLPLADLRGWEAASRRCALAKSSCVGR